MPELCGLHPAHLLLWVVGKVLCHRELCNRGSIGPDLHAALVCADSITPHLGWIEIYGHDDQSAMPPAHVAVRVSLANRTKLTISYCSPGLLNKLQVALVQEALQLSFGQSCCATHQPGVKPG